MKKVLFFAMALVAGVLAFTSCDKKEVDSPLVGKWSFQEAKDMYFEITFDGKGNYTYVMDYYFYDEETGELFPTPHEHVVFKGSYTISGDIATIHYETQTISMDGGAAEEIAWETDDEQMKFRVEGKTLYLTRYYGTEDSWEAIFTKQ